MYYPIQLASKIDKLLSKDPEITNFSRSNNNIGQSYVTYAKRYYSYKVLIDSFDEIEDIVKYQSCDTVDTSALKKTLEEK